MGPVMGDLTDIMKEAYDGGYDGVIWWGPMMADYGGGHDRVIWRGFMMGGI